MAEFENTIRIERSVGEVFAFLSDFENIPNWNYYVLETETMLVGLSDNPRLIASA